MNTAQTLPDKFVFFHVDEPELLYTAELLDDEYEITWTLGGDLWDTDYSYMACSFLVGRGAWKIAEVLRPSQLAGI